MTPGIYGVTVKGFSDSKTDNMTAEGNSK